MKIQPLLTTDSVVRSLLQKAVRRNSADVAERAFIYLISNNDFVWLKNRLAVITFEECWNYGKEINLDGNPSQILESYLNLANSIKNKNAAGLGSLAYALSNGDNSVLNGSKSDKDIKIVSEGVKRPNDYWKWVKSIPCSHHQGILRNAAEKGYKRASWPWDKGFAIAAAYLGVLGDIPPVTPINSKSSAEFPFWVGIDKHTPQGKVAIAQAANHIGVNVALALQLSFYFESARCDSISHSPWWERELSWKMKSLNISAEYGMQLWEKIRPVVKELLSEEEVRLKWKIENSNSKSDILLNNQTTIF